MKTRNTIFVALASLMMCACSLDEYPYGFYSEENFYKTDADALAATNYIYDAINYIEYSRAIVFLGDMNTDVMYPKGDAKTSTKELDGWKSATFNTNTTLYNFYKYSYITINRANSVIENVGAMGFWNVVKMIPALLVAVCIHRCTSDKMQFFYRTLFVVPMVIPGLITVLIWRSFFFEATNGYLNQFLDWSGLMHLLQAGGVHVSQWLASPDAGGLAEGSLGRAFAEMFGWLTSFKEGTSPAWLGDPNLLIIACVIWATVSIFCRRPSLMIAALSQ